MKRTCIAYCILGILLAAPHAWRLLQLGNNYTPFLLEASAATTTSIDETYAYMPQVNRVAHNQPITDSYTLENRQLPSPFLSEWLPAAVLGNIAKLSGSPLALVFVKIFGPVFLIFLLSKIFQQAEFSPALSFISALATVFVPKLFALLPYPSLFSYLSNVELEFQRLFHPMLSWIVIALSIIFLQKALRATWSPFIIFISGIFLGLLFYTYIFAWTWVWYAVGILMLGTIVRRDYKDLRRLIIPIVVGMSIGIPYFQNAARFSAINVSQDFITKSTFPIRQTHFLLIIRYAVLVIFLIATDRKWITYSRRRILLALLLSGMFLPDMSQFILGYNLEADHWIERFLYPLSTSLFILGCGSWLALRSKRCSKLFLGCAALLVSIRLGLVLRFELPRQVLGFQLGGERKTLFEWMNKNIPRDSVVGGLSFVEQTYIAAYTPFYPYLPRGDRTLTTTDETLSRYIFISSQFRVSADYLDRTLSIPPEQVPILDNIPAMDQRAVYPLFDVRFLYDREANYVQRLALREKAKQMLADHPQQIGRLDYLLVGPTERFFAGAGYTTCCQLLYGNDKYELYKYNEF